MRIIFFDIKENVFLLRTYYNIINNIKMKFAKDGAILANALKEKDIQVLNYVPIKNKKEKAIEQLKYGIICAGNKINPEKIQNIYDLGEIRNDDIYIAWYFYPKHMELLRKISCKKVVMGQHFCLLPFNTDFTEMGVNWFVNQVDVSRNDFVNHFFNLKNVENVTLPYSFEERFKCTRAFKQRKAKALSIGTISTVNGKGYDIYLEYMKNVCIQPMRKTIFEKGSNEYIDVYNSYLFTMGYNNSLNSLSKFDEYIKAKIADWKEVSQAKYYSFDMVEKYNEYMMCICGEEQVGLPGIGFVESMACGCAYIGIDHEMYRKLGLVPGEHYITYDGTYDNLVEKVQYYQENIEELEAIAERGMKFVITNLNSKTVVKRFFEKLRSF